MELSDGEIWTIIVALGVGTFLIRFSFLGLLGDRPLPPWILRLLRYTPVSLIPGLVAPLVIWPGATGGTPDPARLLAALATVAVGLVTRNVLAAIIGGGAVLFLSLAVL